MKSTELNAPDAGWVGGLCAFAKGSSSDVSRVLYLRGDAALRATQELFLVCPALAVRMTVWPSGLRRWLKAPVRKGVGSNPTAVTLIICHGWGAFCA